MLVAIEGIDGAGKDTLARGLMARAEAEGARWAMLSFPRYDQTRFAKLIAQYLNGAFGPRDQVSVHFAALLYAGDRFESRDHLLALLSAHEIVVLDRYVASNMAYNGAKLAAGPARRELIDWIAETEYGLFELPRPDLTLLLATDAATADDRVGRKGRRGYTEQARDLHEADPLYMAEVAQVYGELADESWRRIEPLDGAGALRPPEDIQAEAWEVIAAARALNARS